MNGVAQAQALQRPIHLADSGNYIAKRAIKADEAAFRKVLAKVPKGEPAEERDKLPKSSKRK